VYTQNNAPSNIVNALVEQMQHLSENQPAPTPQSTTEQKTEPTPTQPNQEQTPPPSFYTLSLTVLADNNDPLPGATATMNPAESKTTDQNITSKATTDKHGHVQFPDLPSGIYILKVEHHGNPIAESMINVAGANPVLTLGMHQQKQPVDWTIIALGGITAFILILFLLNHFGIVGKLRHTS
jgi:hypothetical protein